MDFLALTTAIFDRIAPYQLVRHTGFAEVITDKDKKYPAVFCTNGEFKHVDGGYDWNEGIAYVRVNGRQSQSDAPESAYFMGCQDLQNISIPLRLVLIARRDKWLPFDAAQTIASAIGGNYRNLALEIGAVYVSVNSTDTESNYTTVLEDEFEGVDIRFDTSLMAIYVDIVVELQGDAQCLATPACIAVVPEPLWLAGVSNGRLYRSINGGTTWAETQPAGNFNATWAGSHVATLGTFAFVTTNTKLYRSNDGGATWVELTSPNANTNLGVISGAKENGKVLAIGTPINTALPNIFLSDTNGLNLASFTIDGITTAREYTNSKMSSNGQKIVVAGDNRDFRAAGVRFTTRLTTDNGATWSTPFNVSNSFYVVYAVNDLLDKIFIAEFNSVLTFNSLKRTIDGGATWDTAAGVTSGGFFDMSGDGTTLYWATSSILRKSTNNGTSFTTLTIPSRAGNIQEVRTNLNGLKLLVLTSQRAYLSLDGGTTWAQTQPNGNSNFNWDLGFIQ